MVPRNEADGSRKKIVSIMPTSQNFILLIVMSPIITFQSSPSNHKWTIYGSTVMTVMAAWEDWHHINVCIPKQLSENPAFFLAPLKCKCYSNIYGLTLMIRRMLDVPTSLSNHLLLIVTFQS
jgi:hypothetical protein